MIREYHGHLIAIGLHFQIAKENLSDTLINIARTTSFYIDDDQERHRDSLPRRWKELTT